MFLPRGTGSGLAGTLCQSATSGKACIWDNLDCTTGALLGWKNVTLNVNQMQDGDMLSSNCTGCHKGNNAFLMSPDDATWAKILRPANRAADVGVNFTTNVDPGITRYPMISNQPTWGNTAGPQCISCHERPTVGFTAVPTPMPPNCANGANNPAAFYNYTSIKRPLKCGKVGGKLTVPERLPACRLHLVLPGAGVQLPVTNKYINLEKS